MPEPKKYTTERGKTPVVLVLQGGEEKSFFLNEMEGDRFEDYMDENQNRLVTSIDDEKGTIKITGVKSYKGMYSSLLIRCMTEAGTGEYVSAEFINSLPLVTRKGLFEVAQKLNAIVEESDTDLKN